MVLIDDESQHWLVWVGSVGSIEELAARFGLSDDSGIYELVDVDTAGDIVTNVLHRDLAYGSELMPFGTASGISDRFVTEFLATGARFYSNGLLGIGQGSWTPATNATFDTGVIAWGSERSGCIWVEAED